MKRSATDPRIASFCKRRAPYASRACEACRKRKGKCDGQQPCDFCAGRSQECVYDGIAPDDSPTQHLSDPSTISHHNDKPTATRTLRHGSITELVLEVKNQLDSLSRRVESQAASFAAAARPGGDRRGDSHRILARESISEDRHRRSFEQTSVVTTQCFYGPTSPDYSLNIAQIRVRQTGSSSDVVYHRQLQLASIDSEPAVANGTVDEGDIRELPTPFLGERGSSMHLMAFRALINYREALRLLALYQDIVGDFHPFVNLDKLVARTRAWYVGEPQDMDSDRTGELSLEEDLITYNLVLAIALHADPESRNSDVEAIIWRNCKADVNSRLISRTTGTQHVVIVLLKAWYDFVNDLPRSAWRTCGIAGRMLMELGFHDYEVMTRLMASEKQRTEARNLLCSITVLDRQWSASTGLPANFDANSFDASLKTNIENPYLKAMMSLILISDKFHEPISRAAKGGKYPDDDRFEVLDFQIEQWRKKSIGSYSFCNIRSWEADPTKRPPSWAIILHLRAESIRSLLLRPFFFTHADTTSTQKYLRPAVDLLVRVTDILYRLDATTELYQKHHPFYQHVLASSTALSFLLAATMEQNKDTILRDLTPDLKMDYSHSFDMSVVLASKYASMSRLSRKLLKRLADMREILQQLGLLENNIPQEANPVSKVDSSGRNVPDSSTDSNEAWCNLQATGLDFPLTDGSDHLYPSDTAPLGESQLSQGWPDSFLTDWFFDDLEKVLLNSNHQS
ncbi:Activator of stress genes 1 [Fusarium oxysporum f. sp. raphani]|uniref:Activator of stress genes 1 n=1 Tax=Fusarium oxysporum f. sp. raphani TaxID=96318 RepID=A0A8J5PG47_FUSOX|nr:Activator of stress genes 1 [Fusarium oxysporum f. sp. raphani]